MNEKTEFPASSCLATRPLKYEFQDEVKNMCDCCVAEYEEPVKPNKKIIKVQPSKTHQ